MQSIIAIYNLLIFVYTQKASGVSRSDRKYVNEKKNLKSKEYDEANEFIGKLKKKKYKYMTEGNGILSALCK